MLIQWGKNCNLLCRLLTLSVEQYSQLLIQRAILQPHYNNYRLPNSQLVFPTCFSKQIHIEFPGWLSTRRKRIFDLSGNCVLNHLINHNLPVKRLWQLWHATTIRRRLNMWVLTTSSDLHVMWFSSPLTKWYRWSNVRKDFYIAPMLTFAHKEGKDICQCECI